MSKLFLFKENTDDRDCVRYVDSYSLNEGGVRVCGACFYGSFGNVPYENVTTILTEEEYNLMLNHNGEDLSEIIDRLRGEENQKLFESVQAEEIEWLMDEYDLSEEEVLDIFEDYDGSYRDRSIINHVYENAYDIGYQMASEWGYICNDNLQNMERYFDFEKFGEDLADDYYYFELSDGRIVSLSY